MAFSDIFQLPCSSYKKLLRKFRVGLELRKELTRSSESIRIGKRICYAGMAELADALDLGSSGRPCRFKSCCPYSMMTKEGFLKYFRKPSLCIKNPKSCMNMNFMEYAQIYWQTGGQNDKIQQSYELKNRLYFGVRWSGKNLALFLFQDNTLP